MRKDFKTKMNRGAAVLLAALTLTAGGCAGKADSQTTAADTTASQATTEAAATTAENITTKAAQSTTQAPTQAPTTEVETTTAAPVTPSEFTLDGVKEHHFISDSYCYLESEKYFLLLDKDIDLPGDFAVTVDVILDALEEELGLSAMPDDYEYSGMGDFSVYYDGFDPWEQIDPGKKIPILVLADPEAEGRTSSASASNASLAMLALYADTIWEPGSPLAQTGWEKPDYVDYSEIAHELTHVISSRNCEMSKIMSEGLADHMMYVVIDKLADQYPSIAETKEKTYRFDFIIPEVVNAESAERIFVYDFHDRNHAQSGAEYVIGRYLCEYLRERFGREFYRTYNDIIKAKHLDYVYGNYKEENAQAFADGLKEAFGEDIFVQFGNWCVEKDVLQHVYTPEE
ncbi:MAG: hypothetical protein IKS10_01755 [Lachnospiraceae bacterium]|nr:hypothetical protein [Lachnospiraceae bacterium]